MESLYQEQLLALARKAREKHPCGQHTHHAQANNPVCGDRVSAQLTVTDNIIADADIQVKGCALCEAGAGLWLDAVIGCRPDRLGQIHDDIRGWLDGTLKTVPLDSAVALEPVKAIKNRHKCVLLAFSTAGKFTPL